MVNKLFDLQTKGISRRQKFFGENWYGHLENSRMISLQAIEPKLLFGKSLTILGAGQLLDFPNELFNKYSEQITLIDKSKLALKAHSNKTILYDVTGTLETWASYLLGLKVSKPEDLLIPLQTISTSHPLLSEPCFRDEVLLSLNILSQLPVYWQNSVFEIFRKKFSIKLTDEWEGTILKALIPSFRALIKSHLKTLIPEGRHKESILITDTHYLNYTLGKANPLSDHYLQIDLEANEIQTFDVKPAKNTDLEKLEVMDALFDVSIKEELSPRCNITLLHKWLWDIIPYGKEDKDSGTMHRVVALRIGKVGAVL